MSLAAGTGSYRVKETMARIAVALGVDRHHAQVTLTEITSTPHRGPSFRTEVAEVATVGVNASRLAALEALSDSLERSDRPVRVDDVTAALDRIEAEPAHFGVVLQGLCAGVACAAFAFLIGGGPYEVVGALLGGWVGQMVRRLLLHGTTTSSASSCWPAPPPVWCSWDSSSQCGSSMIRPSDTRPATSPLCCS